MARIKTSPIKKSTTKKLSKEMAKNAIEDATKAELTANEAADKLAADKLAAEQTAPVAPEQTPIETAPVAPKQTPIETAPVANVQLQDQPANNSIVEIQLEAARALQTHLEAQLPTPGAQVRENFRQLMNSLHEMYESAPNPVSTLFLGLDDYESDISDMQHHARDAGDAALKLLINTAKATPGAMYDVAKATPGAVKTGAVVAENCINEAKIAIRTRLPENVNARLDQFDQTVRNTTNEAGLAVLNHFNRTKQTIVHGYNDAATAASERIGNVVSNCYQNPYVRTAYETTMTAGLLLSEGIDGINVGIQTAVDIVNNNINIINASTDNDEVIPDNKKIKLD